MHVVREGVYWYTYMHMDAYVRICAHMYIYACPEAMFELQNGAPEPHYFDVPS